MESLFEFLVAAFLVIAGVFGFVGSFGLLKLNDPMSRLHAPTKATTLGVGGVLLASMLHAAAFEKYFSVHELMITLFLFLTAPITANFIAKVHIHRQESRDTMPSAGEDDHWATHDTPEDEERKNAGRTETPR
ncbi:MULTISPECIES: Na+/H+ antiporter subunit G [unclassified Leisingera]|uniref:Na+/H+ antiporter subunit G n=1 Tax=unclassified Leisingera TaxID=2614906 RepID=UPI0010114910|nr:MULTISPECIES: Na+/H+ antiporter subunit G [unclassified Leisingera]MBQ4824932.1 Na+/H+ antiporter subunit G [Leisingera sp. HS039]QAX29363.1 Na+/H+ antiporter subunit G [Leisingera sp. NJS204]QBR36128.1 Na+/H+ antiporter subunit G [Leisingera sp. NJS201]